MSHWAEIDNDNKVIRVLVCSNDDPNGDEGFQWLNETFGGVWIQTSYNGNFRKNFAGIDYKYDKTKDAFIPPKNNCHPEEILNEETCRWECSNASHTPTL